MEVDKRNRRLFLDSLALHLAGALHVTECIIQLYLRQNLFGGLA